MWFYIARQNEIWIPPLEINSSEPEIYKKGPLAQYFVSIYYSVLMLAGNDMSPQGDLQIIFATIFILAASIINASIFGNIAVILQQINRKQSSFHEKVENATSTMRNMIIPEELQNQVLSYLISTQTTLDQQKEFDYFLKLLSPSLRSQVTKHIFQESILCNPIFENKVEVTESILYDLYTVFYLPEDEICRQGGPGEYALTICRHLTVLPRERRVRSLRHGREQSPQTGPQPQVRQLLRRGRFVERLQPDCNGQEQELLHLRYF